MKRILTLCLLMVVALASAQVVYIDRMERVVQNNDKHLYKIKDTINALYLGQIEVRGFAGDDVATFKEVYKKAKQMGANAFRWKPILDVDGGIKAFDPNFYLLSLYYVKPEDLHLEQNIAYIIGAPVKSVRIAINKKKTTLAARSYIRLPLQPGIIYTVNTLKFLGAGVKMSAKHEQDATYFQVSGFRVNSNTGKFGINLQSGDIYAVETSYGMFLTTIYELQKPVE